MRAPPKKFQGSPPGKLCAGTGGHDIETQYQYQHDEKRWKDVDLSTSLMDKMSIHTYRQCLYTRLDKV